MRKFAVLDFLFIGQGSAASVCDISNNGSHHFQVIRDGKPFTEYTRYGDFWSALYYRNQAIEGNICELPANLHTCDVIRIEESIAVSRSGHQFTAMFAIGDYKNVIKDLKLLVENKVCKMPEASSSVCDVETIGSGSYYVTKNGRRFSQYTGIGDMRSAVRIRDEFIAAGLCVRK